MGVEILKAKRKPNFNDEELDVNLSCSQTQNLNLDHHQIPCQNPDATTVLVKIEEGRMFKEGAER